MNTKTTGSWLVAFATTLAGLGCGHVESHGVAFDPSTQSSSDVAVFASSQPQAGQEVGTIVVKGREGSSVNALYGELKRQTRELGGNAVFVESRGARNDEHRPVYTALSSSHDCGASCAKGDASTKGSHETMTVELRGKAMRLSPEELKASQEWRAP